jgi:hypothetical protein
LSSLPRITHLQLSGIRLTKDFAEALFPAKKIASVYAVPDKNHGFIYLVRLFSGAKSSVDAQGFQFKKFDEELPFVST